MSDDEGRKPDLKVVPLSPKGPMAHGALEALDWFRKEVERGDYDAVMVIAARNDDVHVIDCAGPSLVRALGLLEAARHTLLTSGE